MAVVLELQRVSKQFGSQHAVRDVSLGVERGEFFALLGPSGCGKTTTLRLVGGFEQPTAGTILLNGNRIDHLRPYERPVSTVFQNYALFPHLTARGNVEFGLHQKQLTAAEIHRKVRDAFDLVQMNGKEDRLPAQLSGGEKQRIALARSLVIEPEILLLDEPLSALDPNLRKQVRSELKALQRRVGTTFIFVTHDKEEALSMSDRIALLHAGRLVQTGTPQDLYLRPDNRFAATFLGQVNWVGSAAVRPELTRITRDPPFPGVRGVNGVVESSTFLGNCLHIAARLPSGDKVIAEVARADSDFQTGEPVHLWWHAQDELPGLSEG